MIQAYGLQKTYFTVDGTVAAVDGVSLHIRPGEFAAVVGASGSGKSTLMHILGLLDCADCGSYRLDGVETAGLRGRELARLRSELIGFVFQNYNLIPRMTALENVELSLLFRRVPAGKRREAALDALDAVGLSDRINHIPAAMSGGQQQRVAIARAIAGMPRLILADEPTGNLDPESSQQVLSLLKDLNRRGATVCLITHDRHVASSADRKIRIQNGRIVHDSAEEIL